MNDSMRPLNLGEILDRTIQIFRERFLVFFGIAALTTGVILALASIAFIFLAWVGSDASNWVPSSIGDILLWIFLAVLGLLGLPVWLVVGALGTAALNHAAVRAFNGEKPTILASFKDAWKYRWRYLWLYVLEGLIVVGAPLTLWTGVTILAFITALALKGGDTLQGVVVLVGGIAFAVYYLVALMRLWMAFPSCVVEGSNAWASVKRGNRLSQGTRGRMFVLWLLGTVLGRLLSLGLAVPLSIAIELVPGANSLQHQNLVGMIILFILFGSGFAVQALTRPVYAIATVLFYYDQRIRKEGFDIEWLMRQAGMVAAPPPLPDAVPWLPPVPGNPPQPAQVSPATPGEPS